MVVSTAPRCHKDTNDTNLFKLIYKALNMLPAIHPAIIFIKRRIEETRKLVCVMFVYQPAYALGVFEAGILPTFWRNALWNLSKEDLA